MDENQTLDHDRIMKINIEEVMKDELNEVKEKYGDARRTMIKPDDHEFNPEDFYPNDPWHQGAGRTCSTQWQRQAHCRHSCTSPPCRL